MPIPYINTNIIRLFSVLVVSALLTSILGCAPPTAITTRLDKDYPRQIKKIFVISQAGSEFGGSFGSSFSSRFVAAAKDCGVEAEVSSVLPSEPDKNIHFTRIKDFYPDVIMKIQRAGGTKTPYGFIIEVKYDVGLFEVKTEKQFWRADVEFARGSTMITLEKRGEALAMDLVNILKKDGILQSCVDPKAKQ
jgi:hypothetical protein